MCSDHTNIFDCSEVRYWYKAYGLNLERFDFHCFILLCQYCALACHTQFQCEKTKITHIKHWEILCVYDAEYV